MTDNGDDGSIWLACLISIRWSDDSKTDIIRHQTVCVACLCSERLFCLAVIVSVSFSLVPSDSGFRNVTENWSVGALDSGCVMPEER